MIGLDKLLEVRKEGIIPEVINIWVGHDNDPYYEGEWHKYSDTQKYPCIIIEPEDNIDALDFRVMFAMTVFIRGDLPEKMLKVYQKIEKCKPDRVMIFNHGGLDIEILDNKGLLSGIITA